LFERYRVPFNWMLAAQDACLVAVVATFSSAWRSSKFDANAALRNRANCNEYPRA
jgi:uncharacterized membrane protein